MGARYRSATTGVIVNVDDVTARALSVDYEPYDPAAAGADAGDDGDTGGAYGSLKVADLRAEIDRRNEGRDEADRLSTEGKKADLVATLEADDQK